MGITRLVLIEWEDSHTEGGWQSLDCEIEDRALVCRSVGWLVLDGEVAKVIAPHIHEKESGVLSQGSGIMTIPARSVIRLIDLMIPLGITLKSAEDAYPLQSTGAA